MIGRVGDSSGSLISYPETQGEVSRVATSSLILILDNMSARMLFFLWRYSTLAPYSACSTCYLWILVLFISLVNKEVSALWSV